LFLDINQVLSAIQLDSILDFLQKYPTTEVARQLLLTRGNQGEQVGHCPQGRTGDCYKNKVRSCGLHASKTDKALFG